MQTALQIKLTGLAAQALGTPGSPQYREEAAEDRLSMGQPSVEELLDFMMSQPVEASSHFGNFSWD